MAVPDRSRGCKYRGRRRSGPLLRAVRKAGKRPCCATARARPAFPPVRCPALSLWRLPQPTAARPPSHSGQPRAPRHSCSYNSASSQLKCRQAEEGEDDGENPESDDDGILLPTTQLEMMMNRRHGEEPFAGEFETQDLEDDRECLDYENAAHHGQEQLLFTANRDYPDRAANRKRAGIAHEDPGGMTVEPEKTEAGADQRGTEN